MKIKLISKKSTLLTLISTLLGLFVIGIKPVMAAIVDLTARGIAMSIIKLMFQVFLTIAQFITGLSGQLFNAILKFGFEDMDAVHMGWTISRDIVNMFFILGLVVIAFATILRIETYGIKALLPKLIIIAILINFSYLACGIIIDASQIATAFFVSGIGSNDIGQVIIDSTGVAASIKQDPGKMQGQMIAGFSADLSLILTMAFALLVIGLTGIMLLIGAVLLFLRMGALWILIILAPFAWFFSIFPTLKSRASKWWSEFIKWSFFAPIYVFFIYLAIMMANETTKFQGLGESSDILKQVTLGTEMTGNFHLLFAYVLIIILLFGAPIVAMSMGIQGASAVIGFSKKLSKSAIRTGARKFERSVLAPKGLSPRTFRAAWKARREEQEAKKMEPAIGAWRDRLNMVMGREKTFHKQRADDLLESKERRELTRQGLSKEGLSDFTAAAKKSKNVPKFKAGMAELISRGDEEGLFEHEEMGKDYNYITSPENMQKLIKSTLPKKEAIRFAGKMGALAKMSNIPQYDGMTEYDPRKEEMVWVDEKDAGTRGGYEAMKIHPQARWRATNRRAFLTMDRDGNPREVTNALKVMLRLLTKDDATRAAKEMPGINQQYIIKGKTQIQAEINTITEPDQKKLAQDWLDKIDESVVSEAPEAAEAPFTTA